MRNTIHLIIYYLFLFYSTACLVSCTNNSADDTPSTQVEEENENPEEPIDSIPDTPQPGISFYNKSKVYNGFVLINDAASNSVYIIDKNGNTIHNWPLGTERLGNDAYLLPNGKLLAMFEAESPAIQIGGFGGKLQLLNKDGSAEWSFQYATDDYILHHDAEMLPNGNIIAQIWERKSLEEAKQAGSTSNTDVFPDGIIEIDPSSNTIVWEWYVWNHLIQDNDSSKDNYGIINENPQLIDLNFVTAMDGDITHANGLAYDEANDVIYLSVNFFSEIWVIDHSTTTIEASSHQGGNFNKGGDLLYRFGNPSTYKNIAGQRLFHNNHYPNLLKGADLGNILVYSNGGASEMSTVYELRLPEEFSLQPNSNNEPEVIWSFKHPNLFAPKVSGAEKLPNGNILITEGDFGFWEVTNEKEVVWQFQKTGFYWRGYHFNKNDDAIINLNLGL